MVLRCEGRKRTTLCRKPPRKQDSELIVSLHTPFTATRRSLSRSRGRTGKDSRSGGGNTAACTQTQSGISM